VFWVGEEEGVCCWVERGGLTVLCPLVKEGELRRVPLSSLSSFIEAQQK